MPWKRLLQDPDIQKEFLKQCLSIVGVLLPIFNTWRLNRLSKRVKVHHKACKEHRMNPARHRS